MKTLFFVSVLILLGTAPLTAASAEDPFVNLNTWRPVNQNEFADANTAPKTFNLTQLDKLLYPGAKMSDVVSSCGLPDAEYDPTTMPHPGRGIVMSGGVIYWDGLLLGHEEDINFRYDLPGQGRVYITTTKDRLIERALFYSPTTGQVQFLIKL